MGQHYSWGGGRCRKPCTGLAVPVLPDINPCNPRVETSRTGLAVPVLSDINPCTASLVMADMAEKLPEAFLRPAPKLRAEFLH